MTVRLNRLADEIANRFGDNSDRQDEGNAALLLAAPELLAALKKAVMVMQDYDIDEHLAGEFEVFTDAIAKAEGSAHA
jgi:hypothetical protein